MVIIVTLCVTGRCFRDARLRAPVQFRSVRTAEAAALRIVPIEKSRPIFLDAATIPDQSIDGTELFSQLNFLNIIRSNPIHYWRVARHIILERLTGAKDRSGKFSSVRFGIPKQIVNGWFFGGQVGNAVSRFVSLEKARVRKYLNYFGWPRTKIVNLRRIANERVGCSRPLVDAHLRYDAGHYYRRTIDVQRRIGGSGSRVRCLPHFVGYANQLVVEHRDGDGSGSHYGGEKYQRASRIALAIVAAIAGIWCLVWGLRLRGQCDWRLIVVGWLLFEASAFTWFYDPAWAWFRTWIFGA